jgi:hypothetical protein
LSFCKTSTREARQPSSVVMSPAAPLVDDSPSEFASRSFTPLDEPLRCI